MKHFEIRITGRVQGVFYRESTKRGAKELGIDLSDDEVEKITVFLYALTGEQPKVQYPILSPSTAATSRPRP